MQFLIQDVFGFSHEELDTETIEAILGEAAKLARDVLAPLNWEGDQNGATLKDDKVTTAPGWKEAYAQYRDGGWNAVPFDPDYGGQGLPYALAFPIQEMWQAANMSFGLCPLLNQGAVEAILHHGSQEQKDEYLEKLISGEWTGTMNLTEPQAGSDIGLIKTKAEPDGDTYKITGQKIYITYGDHDMADNIIHLVLARLPDAPDDVKGISLFIVPKILRDGTPNTVKPIGLEHKLGIHASPTCTMEFAGAEGYLIGEPHQGLKAMFTMMNNARLSVGLQGVAIAERAYQHAAHFAAERVQGKDFDTGQRATIDQHPDVQRNLLTMRSQIEAGRALTYQAALALDAKDPVVDILTPIVKSWCTDMAVEVASLGIQIHGGMGFVEETGAAQYLRDARILPIYEGTNGIQAADLMFRKTLRDGGVGMKAYIEEHIRPYCHSDRPQGVEGSPSSKERSLGFARDDNYADMLLQVTDLLVKEGAAGNMKRLAFAAQPYLKAFGIIAGGALLSRSVAALTDQPFADEKRKTANFYINHIMPLASGYLHSASMEE
jgi:alkylation response protein AidB-like acyl-CoA dehydrogenase